MIDRLNAALEGRYRLERELGEGGMATVFLAEDLRHGRSVAVKVLRPELAAVVGAERFLAEIRTTAALQHPHILPLHDSGEAAGFLFYVMPHVQGESLRDRLDRERQLPVEEAVDLARKVAAALQYAHEQGVIHRDIKPANILLSRGNPLVADFGIALALSEAGGGRITETGLSLGTPHYMSPEQATGERVLDRRSDVYGLGCVLYEMLSGEPPFPGPSAQAVLARILTGDPRRVTETRRTVPPHVDAVVAKALERLPADRFESAEDFAAALDDPSFDYSPAREERRGGAASRRAGAARAAASGWLADARSKAAAIAMGVLLLVTLAAVARSGAPPTSLAAAGVLPAHRFTLAESGAFSPDNGIAVADDGTVVYGSDPGGDGLIMVRFAGELRPRAVEGTQGGFHPTFSPDGEWIAFSVGPELRKVPTRGGPVVSIARTETPPLIMPDWGPDGVIAVAKSDGLYKVPEVGGIPEKVYEAPSSFGARGPLILPGDAGWLFARVNERTGGVATDVMHLDPETGDTTVVAEGGSSATWLPTGHVAFVHTSGSLFAAPFDLRRREFASAPAPVLDSIRYGAFSRTFDVSGGGAAAYVSGSGGLANGTGGQVTFLGVDGGETRTPPLERTDHPDGRFSPDGQKLAYTNQDQIWIFDLELGTNLRLTTEGRSHHDPVWSPDGTRIAFGSERGSTDVDVWVQDAEGAQPARPVLEMEGVQYPKEWTRDGLLVVQTNHAGNPDIYTMPAEGGAPPRPYLRADWNESLPRVSPDGRWLVYGSQERDQPGVYVRAFPVPGGAYLVSEAGRAAIEPAWSPDGGTIYYRQGGEVIAAEVRTSPTFEVVGRRPVATVQGTLRDAHPREEWLLVFAFGSVRDGENQSRLIGVANWYSELADRLGGSKP